MAELRVIKVGGNEADDPQWLAALARGLAELPGQAVLVHGGGKEVTELQRVLGAEARWQEGLRVTTPEVLRAVTMVLSGAVNKRLVGALLDARVDAVGLSGEDGALLRARLVAGGALGRVGEVVEVRVELLWSLLAQGITPVVSPVSRGTDGRPLNVNADDAAAAIAASLGATELQLVSNVAGVQVGGVTLSELEAEEIEPLIATGVASGGMAPKLRAAASAIRAGVGCVRIGGIEMLVERFAGTRIRATSLAGVQG
jgi:acetylglutamate kinase